LCSSAPQAAGINARRVTLGFAACPRVLPVKPLDGPAATAKEHIMASRKPLPKARPTHRLFQVTGTGASAFWREIGAAWPNKDGQGFSLAHSAIPLSGRIVMREIAARTSGEAQQ
jgi:hypothetical protein